jgi:NaMN:DMB phosphoribosyltransferase
MMTSHSRNLQFLKQGKGDVAEVETAAIEETENEAAIEETENAPRRSERTSQPTQRLIEEATLHAAKCEVALTQAEIKCHEATQQLPEGEFAPGEMACAGAGTGGGFVNTKELHVLKCDQATNGPDKEKWKQAVQEEHK